MTEPVLGLLLATLHTGSSATLWPAIASEVHRQGMNLICFPGGRLGQGPESEIQRNRVYDLAGPACVDGLITWASSLGGTVEAASLESFHQRFRDLPMVSLAHRLEGVPVIRIDAYSGMRQLFEHLVSVHGYRRIAYLRGPGEHQSAQARFRAYVDALEAQGLEFDERLVAGPLPWDAGQEAISCLLDERGLIPGQDFQVVACASDLMAFGAHKALLSRGYRIPQDVALVGCNGTTESMVSQPPMTTVIMPFVRQGEEAVRHLVALMQDGAASDADLPSRLVIRQSCGCPSRSAVMAGRLAGIGDGHQDADFTPGLIRTAWLDSLAALGDFSAEQIQAWFEPFFDAFMDDLESMNPEAGDQPFPATSLVLLGKAMERAHALSLGHDDSNQSVWQDVLSLLRLVLEPALPRGRHRLLDSLIDRCRVHLSEFIQRQSTLRLWEAKRRSEVLREVGRALLAAWTVADLADALAQSLAVLEISGAWLVLVDAPSGSHQAPGGGQRRLVLAQREGERIPLAPEGVVFAQGELLPPSFLPRHSPWCLVTEPLYFQDRTVGYAVFQTGTWDGAVYEELRGYLSSALKGVFLFAEAAHARQVAEKADQIKTRLLANVSHELRTPLTQIIGHVDAAASHPSATVELGRIRSSAEHQLRVINDLLDLSRAEIDELDLARELVDPGLLLREVFESFAASQSDAPASQVQWELSLPERLPLIQADPLRLRQIFINLLANAGKFTRQGRIELGARLEPPLLHCWVRDTGSGIAKELQARIFQPFVTGDHEQSGGIGLGLSIARHMVALHFGTLELESEAGQGSTFHVCLPLPNLEDSLLIGSEQRQAVLVRIARQALVPPEIEEFARRQGLTVQTLGLDGVEDPPLEGLNPACLCWDLADARPRDWALVRRLRHHPGLFQAPFILYGQQAEGSHLELGLTGILPKQVSGKNLAQAIEAACPRDGTNPVYVIDDEESSRQLIASVLAASLPDHPLRLFASGTLALEAMANELPGLVVLDFSMPGLDGADVLDRIRADARLRLVPVLMLSNKVFSPEDIKRIEAHAQVTLQSKGVWSPGETGEALNRLLFGSETSPVHTSALVKRALAYITRHYRQALSRWQVAEAVHVSEDYLSRVFTRELGISPWDYLSRYRVHQACLLLRGGSESIRNIAFQVGFNDQAYFSRVFRKVLLCTPQEYRQGH